MCEYEGRHFGARYPDATCIDGYLWDLDSCEDGMLYSGGELPCPKCNTASYLESAKGEAESTSYGSTDLTIYSGEMIMESALHLARKINPEETARWVAKTRTVQTWDWPNRAEVIAGRAPKTDPIEVTMAL